MIDLTWRFLMRKLGYVVLPLLALTGPIEAILPPLYSTLAEYLAILESKDLITLLPEGEAIIDIRRSANGYQIETTKYKLDVEVHNIATGRPGPAQFNLVFGHPYGK